MPDNTVQETKIREVTATFGATQWVELLSFMMDYSRELMVTLKLDMTEAQILGAVALADMQGEDVNINEIAQITGIPQQTVSRRIEKLAEEEWVVLSRSIVRGHPREKRVRMADKAKTACRDFLDPWLERLCKIVAK